MFLPGWRRESSESIIRLVPLFTTQNKPDCYVWLVFFLIFHRIFRHPPHSSLFFLWHSVVMKPWAKLLNSLSLSRSVLKTLVVSLIGYVDRAELLSISKECVWIPRFCWLETNFRYTDLVPSRGKDRCPEISLAIDGWWTDEWPVRLQANW